MRILGERAQALANHDVDYASVPRQEQGARRRERQVEHGQQHVHRHHKSLIMLRQQLIRSLKRPAARAALNGSRAFTASARRPAEVELTIGLCHARLHGGHVC